MGLENIGLEAIFKNADFLKGMGEYRDSLGKGRADTESSASTMTEKLAAVGGTIVTGALAAAAAGVAALAGVAVGSIPAMLGWAGTVDSVGDVLGTSAEESAALAVAIQHVGGNVDAITGQMAFLTRGLVGANGEVGATGEVLNKLGISFTDANGKILPSVDILTAVADKLSTMPDGLEKTALMTSLFGKSGKDLTDTLNALTTEGFAEADAMAKELGLSLNDEAVGGAIEAGKQFEFLKMAGQGLMVQLGKELLPSVIEIGKEFIKLVRDALPKVREMMPQITAVIKTLAGVVIGAIPVVFDIFRGLFDFLINNKPLVVGVLAAIAVAVGVWAYKTIAAAIPAIVTMVTASAPLIAVLLLVAGVVAALGYAWENNFLGMRDTITNFWENSVKPVLGALWEWLSVNVPAAIETLKKFWETVLLPAIKNVWSWIQTNLFPLFKTLAEWLSKTLSDAVKTLKDVWETKLLPALKAVWSWMNTTLFPFLKSLSDFLGAVFGVAVDALGKVWKDTLLPALTSVWDFLDKTLWPLFKQFGDWVDRTFGPIFSTLAGIIRDVLGGAFSWATQKLQELTQFFNNLVDLINGETGGSGGGRKGGLQESPGAGGAGAPQPEWIGPSFGPTPSAGSQTNINNTFSFGGNNISNGMDMAAFDAHILQLVRAEIGG